MMPSKKENLALFLASAAFKQKTIRNLYKTFKDCYICIGSNEQEHKDEIMVAIFLEIVGRYHFQLTYLQKQRSQKGQVIGPKNYWLSKHCTDFCGVGKKLKVYKFQTYSNCPRCGKNVETPTHVIKCHHIDACTLWDTSLEDLCT